MCKIKWSDLGVDRDKIKKSCFDGFCKEQSDCLFLLQFVL